MSRTSKAEEEAEEEDANRTRCSSCERVIERRSRIRLVHTGRERAENELGPRRAATFFRAPAGSLASILELSTSRSSSTRIFERQASPPAPLLLSPPPGRTRNPLPNKSQPAVLCAPAHGRDPSQRPPERRLPAGRKYPCRAWISNRDWPFWRLKNKRTLRLCISTIYISFERALAGLARISSLRRRSNLGAPACTLRVLSRRLKSHGGNARNTSGYEIESHRSRAMRKCVLVYRQEPYT